ncbi:MAG: hypothetical protein KUG79_18245 [Pseudomonadales bacterium]|nr:hypothetical protein [Pseudomonadales bacterium]
MSLEQALAAWDGKSADDIQAIYQSYREQADFTTSIVKLTKTESYQKGSTWLIKAWLEDGNILEATQIKIIYHRLDTLEHWQAKLHILQSMPFMPIKNADKKHVDKFLKVTLIDTNKFVRAWSYNGFYELAKQHPEYTREAKQFFDMAMRDESPSVKARIRNIKKLPWKLTANPIKR